MDGQLCYELDTSKIEKPVKSGPHGGLFLLIDDGMENGIVVKNANWSAGEMSETVKEKHKLGYDILKSTASENLVKIHIQTIQPFTFFPSSKTNKYTMISIKLMTGTDNFLALSNGKKLCSTVSMMECKQRQFMKKLERDCGCLPYGHGVILQSMMKQV